MGKRFMDRENMYRELLRRRIPCPDCVIELTLVLMMAHIWRMHRTEPEIYWNWLPVIQTEYILQVFDVSFPNGHIAVPFPLSYLPGLLPHLERPEVPHQLPALGGQPPYTG